MKKSIKPTGSRCCAFPRRSTAAPLLLLAVLLSLLLATSCDRPKIIPDDTLAQIFHDVYLTNAYIDSRHLRNIDSLNIYEPVFARYGYTSEDIQYTIGNFAKRKSSRLSDVVDRAISLIETQSRFYAHRIAMADTISRIARDRFAVEIYHDSLIRVSRIRDTARIRIVVPVSGEGTYEVSYSYLVDSVDRNENLRTDIWLVDEEGRRSGDVSRRLRRLERERVMLSLTAGTDHRSLVIDLGGYPGKDIKTPSLRVDSLVVRRYLPDAVALDSMARGWFDYRHLDTLSNPLRGVPPVDSLGYVYRQQSPLPGVASSKSVPVVPESLPSLPEPSR